MCFNLVIMKAGIFCLSCALGAVILFALTGAAAADVTSVYGCRFYVDGKRYAEFRINEIDHTEWDDEGIFDLPSRKPEKVDVETDGEPGERDVLRFRLPDVGVEIRVSDKLEYVNARYFGPVKQNLSGECEHAASVRALNRWFSERERQHRRGK